MKKGLILSQLLDKFDSQILICCVGGGIWTRCWWWRRGKRLSPPRAWICSRPYIFEVVSIKKKNEFDWTVQISGKSWITKLLFLLGIITTQILLRRHLALDRSCEQTDWQADRPSACWTPSPNVWAQICSNYNSFCSSRCQCNKNLTFIELEVLMNNSFKLIFVNGPFLSWKYDDRYF